MDYAATLCDVIDCHITLFKKNTFHNLYKQNHDYN